MKKTTLTKDLPHAYSSHIVVSVLIIAVISSIIVALFQMMYSSARHNILHIWENSAIQLSRSTEYYLARPTDAIELSSYHVENMIAEGKSNQEIGQYLVREMDLFAAFVENNYTGVYGYCRGEYLDASGWVPDGDYDPTQRPWYVAAKENGGTVTLVSPFLNLQTKEMMMSVSKLLSDGESVLSIDIFTDGLQKNLDSLVREEGARAAFIMDTSGNVVAHSDHGEIGKKYLKDGNSYQRELAARARSLAEGDAYYEEVPSSGEIIFAEKMNSGWYSVLILDEASLLGSIKYMKLILILFLMLVIFVWYGISRSINRKYREAEQLSQEVNAVADIYETMALVDLHSDQIMILRSSDEFDRLLDGNLSDFSKRIGHFAESMASAESRDLLMQFMNPATYEDRLRKLHSISHDFLNRQGCWLRVQLIVVDRDADGRLRHLIWAIESIDQERKQQEHLRKMAETDALSGLRNRRSGEAHLRSMLKTRQKGLFLLLDIDSFKSINDSYGHAVGDLVIIAVAECLRKTFRASDIVFRLGGDEFAAFAPGVENEDVANRLLQRLHREIARISIPEMAGRPVTVSAGTSFSGADGKDSFEALYQLADQNMYQEKRKKHM